MQTSRATIPIVPSQTSAKRDGVSNRQYDYGLGFTSQFYFCGLPLRLDTYSRCAFQCTYCFAHSRGGAHRDVLPRIYKAERLARRFERIQKGKPEGPIDELIASGQPIHFGGMSDPFSSIEKKHRASLEAMKVLARHDHPTVISTKSDTLLNDEYLEQLVRGRFLVQVSLSSMDESLVAKIDQGTPGPKRLVSMLKILHSLDIPTACRIQPVLPGRERHAEDVVHACAEVGVRHVAVEHLKLGVERQWKGAEEMGAILGIDIREYFKSVGAQRVGREWVLPRAIRLDATLRLRALVRTLGMTFGAADTDLLLLSDGGCCCSGADLVPGFQNYFRHTYLEAARIGVQTGTVQLKNLEEIWAPASSIAKFVNSHSRLPMTGSRGAGVRQYVAENWNGSANGASPIGLFGLEDAGVLDVHGNKIYHISDEFRRLIENQESNR